jgi:hypothetical protein
MANFCNKCGAPVSGIFCVKCGADTRLAASPPPQAAVPPTPAATPVSAAPIFPAPASQGAHAAKFCNKCGSPASGTTFCNQCGADLRLAAAPPAQPAYPAAQTPPPPVMAGASQAMPAPPGSTKGSPLTKILIGFAVVVITVGALAAGGVYYVVYRVKQKVHEVARDVPGLGSSPDNSSSSGGGIMGSLSKMVSGSGSSDGDSSGNSSNGGISGDPCRLLSKAEVGRAIGVEVVATEASEAGCSYLAQGNSGDMTAKHMAAMVGTKGADAKTQEMVQNLSGGLFKAFQSEGHDTGMDKNGNVPVFGFSVDNNAAEAQMRLNAKVLGGLGPGQQGIPGIGDQAMDESGAMMMVRKGDKLIRIMYSTCPCSVDAIKPLAKMLADRL